VLRYAVLCCAVTCVLLFCQLRVNIAQYDGAAAGVHRVRSGTYAQLLQLLLLRQKTPMSSMTCIVKQIAPGDGS
jgi:hypothetical protein